jgi:hypothetical protein
MTDPSERDPIPRTAFWLGAVGLIPFLLCTGALYAVPGEFTPTLLQWLASYAAVILSFAGALHWGFAMLHPDMREADRNLSMAWSVVPALTGWAATLLQALPGLLLLAAAFGVHYAADRQFVQRFALPGWYLRLRTGLTGIAVLCLILAAFHLVRH